MAIESAVTINELNEAWPDGLDPKSQGDDHIRTIKGSLKRTFPNVLGVVTASHSQLNQLAISGTTNVPGMVMMWPYGVSLIPSGWKLCNGVGTISTGQPIPDLLDRFPVGAGRSYGVGNIGGDTSHTHTGTTSVAGHVLTIAQIPNHSHGVPTGLNDSTGAHNTQVSPGNSSGSNTPAYYIQTQAAGGGGAHSHGATTAISSADHRPPYYALCFIIKD